MKKSYGISSNSSNSTKSNFTKEILENGVAIIPNLFNEEFTEKSLDALNKVYAIQENEFGVSNLTSIDELNTVRCPLAYDEIFLSIATNAQVLKVIEELLGSYFILHLQNGIINSNSQHQQGSWHRDLPYQNFTISSPLAISAMVCLTDFTKENGSTRFLMHSHKKSFIEEKSLTDYTQLEAKAGSVILFDSMVVHSAGQNSTSVPRVGINNVYSTPIIKQQICIPSFLEGRYQSDVFLNNFLGYNSKPPNSVKSFRERRFKKL